MVYLQWMSLAVSKVVGVEVNGDEIMIIVSSEASALFIR